MSSIRRGQLISSKPLLSLVLALCALALCLWGPELSEAVHINIYKHRYPFYGGYGYYPFWGGYGGYGGGYGGGITLGGYGRR